MAYCKHIRGLGVLLLRVCLEHKEASYFTELRSVFAVCYYRLYYHVVRTHMNAAFCRDWEVKGEKDFVDKHLGITAVV